MYSSLYFVMLFSLELTMRRAKIPKPAGRQPYGWQTTARSQAFYMPVGTVAGPATGGRSGVAHMGFGGAAKPRGVFPSGATEDESEPEGRLTAPV